MIKSLPRPLITDTRASGRPALRLCRWPTPDLCDVRHTSAEVVEPIRRTLVSERAAEALAATFSVLGDPTRVRLLDALAQQEMCVCELAELVDSSESAVSHQLRLLRSLRLVRSRRSGRLVFYRLDDEHIRRLLDQGRRHIEEETEAEVSRDRREVAS